MLGFSCTMGAFDLYGSIIDNILNYYGYSPAEVGYASVIVNIVGIVVGSAVGVYI